MLRRVEKTKVAKLLQKTGKRSISKHSQLDPSHPTLVTCEVGRAGRHAPRPNDVGGQPRFPSARKGVTLPLLVISGLATGPPAGVGDRLRFLSPR